MRRSTPARLVSIVGTTTIVPQSAAMPEEKSKRGSRRGFTSSVDSQFINATASWLAQRRKTGMKKTSFHPGTSSIRACCTNPNVASKVSAPMPPA